MRYSSAPLVIKSFAKLNLYLQVLNKRKDSFHNLNTLFARIDLADTLIFKRRKDGLIKFKCNSSRVPEDETNLCYRAAALLKQEFNLDSGMEIVLKKRIPVGAGLGGGSANAASVLLGLNKLWNLNLSKIKLMNLGARLGSDVPFFVQQVKFALGSQRGDKIKSLSSLNKIKLWFILIYPNFKVSTPLIYQKFDAYLSADRGFSQLLPTSIGKKMTKKQLVRGLTRPRCNVKMLTSELSKKGKVPDVKYLFNSLEVVTSNLYPAVHQARNALSDMGLDKIMMSGSGPSVFAVCDSRAQAKNLRNKLRKQYKAWQIFAVSAV